MRQFVMRLHTFLFLSIVVAAHPVPIAEPVFGFLNKRGLVSSITSFLATLSKTTKGADVFADLLSQIQSSLAGDIKPVTSVEKGIGILSAIIKDGVENLVQETR